MTPSAPTPVFTEMSIVIDKLTESIITGNTFYDHLMEGTLDDLYNRTITQTAVDLMQVPVDRAIADLPPLADPVIVAEAVTTIVEILSRTFDKDPQSVEKQLNEIVQGLPLSDIREAKIKRFDGSLN